MAEKRLSTLQIKYNDKTLERLRENVQVLIFKSNVTKKKNQRSNNLATGYTDQTLQTVLAFFNFFFPIRKVNF